MIAISDWHRDKNRKCPTCGRELFRIKDIKRKDTGVEYCNHCGYRSQTVDTHN